MGLLSTMMLLTCPMVIGVAQAGHVKTPNPVIGKLSWQIYDAEHNRSLGKGDKQLRLNDIQLWVPAGSKKASGLRIDLGHHFYMELPSNSDSGPHPSGFGLMAGRDDIHSFSWEWFDVDSPGHAVKLQETGELEFAIAKTSTGWPITRMFFPTEISLRIDRMTDPPSDKPSPWRIKIAAGTEIYWPLVVNGKLIPVSRSGAKH